MSNLSNRVKKAKKLTWSHSPRNPGHYGTWGSNREDGRKYYNVDLSHSKTDIVTPDSKKSIVVLQVSCLQDTGLLCDCPGNSRYTVCYHGLGALHESFKKSGKLISFFETYEAALQRKFNGKIVKIKSIKGVGFLWAVIKEWPKKKEQLVIPVTILPAQENINLMRGLEDDEGID